MNKKQDRYEKLFTRLFNFGIDEKEV